MRANQCRSVMNIPPSMGSGVIRCLRDAGHPTSIPVLDWAVCAVCGGNLCKTSGTHRFEPAIVGETRDSHQFSAGWS